jgi:energy-coupling factor transporter ATP-binding protein EcfA2
MGDAISSSIQPGGALTSRLALHGISKQYPAVKANDRIRLRVEPGEIHAVLGENGAGKSTLMKIIYGAVRPDEGEMVLGGRTRWRSAVRRKRERWASPWCSSTSACSTRSPRPRTSGWALDKSWTLADVTVSASRGGRRLRPRRRSAAPRAHAVGGRAPARGDRARAAQKPRLLILDEPTSVLTPQAVQALFVTLRKLATRAAAFSTSATSSTRSGAVPQVHRDARRQGDRRGRSAPGERQPVAPDDRRRAACS